jgi:WD40 repeat protein
VKTGKLQRRFGRRGLPISSVAFAPDGRSLATAGGDWLEDQLAELKLWDLRTGRLRRSRRKRGYFLNLVAYLPSGNLVSSHDREVALLQLWDAQPGQRSWLVVGYDVAESRLSPDRKILAAGHGGGAVDLLDARTLAPLRELLPYDPDLRAVAFSPDGKTVATAAGSGHVNKLELWDAGTGKRQQSISIYGRTVWSLAYLRGGRVLVSGDEEGALQFWDTRRGRLLATLQRLSWLGERSPAAQWIGFTPEGYYDGSPGVERFIRWRVGHQLFPAAQYERLFHRPDLVRLALHGKPLPQPTQKQSADPRPRCGRGERPAPLSRWQ